MTLEKNKHSRTYLILLVLFALILLVFSVVPVANSLHGRGKDYFKWYTAGQAVLQHGDVYTKSADGTLDFMYPPTAAMLMAPLSAAGQLSFVIILQVVNIASLVACVLLSVHLATGRALYQHPLLYAVPTAACLPYVWDNFLLGQPSILLLACLLGGFACLQRSQNAAASALIALAAAIKAFPILCVGYLVYRRNWKAVVLSFVFLATFLVLLPAPFRGFQQNLRDLKTWNTCMALHYNADSIAQRPDRGYSWKNQSLLAVANRLLRPVPKDGSLLVNVVTIPFVAVNVVIVSAMLALCLFYVGTMPSADRRTPRSDSIEYAILILLILMFTPLSFSYLYVWLLYPFAVALQAALTSPAGSHQRHVIVAGFLGCLLLYSFGFPWFRYAQALGNSFWTCVLLVVGLGILLRRVSGSRGFESVPGFAVAARMTPTSQ